jgi:hypothetical protein
MHKCSWWFFLPFQRRVYYLSHPEKSNTGFMGIRVQGMKYWRNRKHIRMLSAVIKHTGICQNMREALRSMMQSGVLLNNFRVFWQIPKHFITIHSTANKFSISFVKLIHIIEKYHTCYGQVQSMSHSQSDCV